RDQLVFGAWDPIPDNAYAAAIKCGVLDRFTHIEPVAGELREVEPITAAFDQSYVKRLRGSNVKRATSKRATVAALRRDIREFKDSHACSRLVVCWCASTEVFMTEGPTHADLDSFEAALDADDRSIAPSMLYAYAALQEGVPFINGAPNLTVDIPALVALANERGAAIGGKDFQTGQTPRKTRLAPMLKARMLGLSGWYSTNILGNRDGEVLDDPENFQTKEASRVGVLEAV